MSHPLSSLEIYHHLKKDPYSKNIFKRVLPLDQIPKRVKFPSAYVINTHKSYQPGEHWLAVFYDKNGHATFFDSFASHPGRYGLDTFLDKTGNTWDYNKTRLQEYGSVVCGYYCVYFIYLMSRGLNLVEILDLFSTNKILNDLKISNLLE